MGKTAPPPQGLVLQHGGHTETLKRGTEAKHKTQQEPSDHVHEHASIAALLTKNSEG